MNPSQPYPWRLYWVLLVTEIIAALAIAPIARDMLAGLTVPIERPHVPLLLLILIGAVQNLVLIGFTLWLGLKLSRSLGLRMPLIERWVGRPPAEGSVTNVGPRHAVPLPHGNRSSNLTSILRSGLLTGVVIGIILAACLLALAPRLPNLPFVIVAKFPIWKRFLACFYGGVYEELFTRLFLLSSIAWLVNRSWRKPAPPLSNAAFWIANILTAILFGLGHLPSALLFMPVTALVVVAALLLNGIAGIAFGYLFRTRGLEAAMVAHFTADFFIWVVGTSLLN
ncbi:MAG TPA: CPBP family intramembrane glutamic endopeptidase [Pyrinomonadaceae bacterium]|jgi:membrane protease YdiL (CAAX protease family)